MERTTKTKRNLDSNFHLENELFRKVSKFPKLFWNRISKLRKIYSPHILFPRVELCDFSQKNRVIWFIYRLGYFENIFRRKFLTARCIIAAVLHLGVWFTALVFKKTYMFPFNSYSSRTLFSCLIQSPWYVRKPIRKLWFNLKLYLSFPAKFLGAENFEFWKNWRIK